MPKPRLITIGPSHYCEKARWALERAGVEFVEHPHAPILHYAATMVHHGQRTTPILVTPHGTIRDSTDILRHADKFVPEPQRLFPTEEPLRREVEELEEEFDRKVGPAARRLAYFHLIDHAAQLKKVVEPRIGAGERIVFRLTRPAVVAVIRRGLRIYPDAAKKSEERLFSSFDEVDARLARGARYLAGDRMTAADLTFAALAAPVVLPPEYGWPLPPFAEVPGDLRALVERFRSRPAGAFVLRLYREERRRSPIPLARGA